MKIIILTLLMFILACTQEKDNDLYCLQIIGKYKTENKYYLILSGNINQLVDESTYNQYNQGGVPNNPNTYCIKINQILEK